jgi:hypothetical protein
MTEHIVNIAESAAPLLIATSPEAIQGIAPNDVTEALRLIAYCLSIVYAIVKLWKHYNPNDDNPEPPKI